jgi:hypothetical protein
MLVSRSSKCALYLLSAGKLFLLLVAVVVVIFKGTSATGVQEK